MAVAKVVLAVGLAVSTLCDAVRIGVRESTNSTNHKSCGKGDIPATKVPSKYFPSIVQFRCPTGYKSNGRGCCYPQCGSHYFDKQQMRVIYYGQCKSGEGCVGPDVCEPCKVKDCGICMSDTSTCSLCKKGMFVHTSDPDGLSCKSCTSMIGATCSYLNGGPACCAGQRCASGTCQVCPQDANCKMHPWDRAAAYGTQNCCKACKSGYEFDGNTQLCKKCPSGISTWGPTPSGYGCPSGYRYGPNAGRNRPGCCVKWAQ